METWRACWRSAGLRSYFQRWCRAFLSVRPRIKYGAGSELAEGSKGSSCFDMGFTKPTQHERFREQRGNFLAIPDHNKVR